MLCGDHDALAGGPPVMAMLMQNANSANVAPDSAAVARGLGREDLFTCVHEQFMTATAKYADILLPAAMFLEYDDLYYGLGHTHLTVGPAVLDRYEDCRTNHELICALAQRLGSNQPSFRMSAIELLDATLRASGRGTWDEAAARGWVDFAEGFEASHFLDGFPSSDGRFHFKPDWAAVGPYHAGLKPLPDHLENYERASEELPFRLVVPPARGFLNTTFTETPGSVAREGEPRALIHRGGCGPARRRRRHRWCGSAMRAARCAARPAVADGAAGRRHRRGQLAERRLSRRRRHQRADRRRSGAAQWRRRLPRHGGVDARGLERHGD